jgi:predicted nucleotidyltransferase
MDMQDDWLCGLRAWASSNDSVRELWLFGSRAAGCSSPGSDVDLAVALMPADEALGKYFALADKSWKPKLEEIVGRHVSLEAILPDTPEDEVVRGFGIRLWCRFGPSHPMPSLILKRASASRSSGEWRDDDYDVFADGAVVGRIFLSPAAPEPTPWVWSLAHHARTPTFGYEQTRTAAMAAFAKSWRGD